MVEILKSDETLDLTEKNKQTGEVLDESNTAKKDLINDIALNILYQANAKSLFDYIKKQAGNSKYYFEGINSIKDGDIVQKVSDFNEIQISDLLDQYNKDNSKNIIDKDSFLKSFNLNKVKIKVKTEYKGENELLSTQENQEVSNFILTPQQEQKIKENVSKIIKNGEFVTKIKLIGEASADAVTDLGRNKAEKSINDSLNLLKQRGFDISILPTFTTIKDQSWFDKDKENNNPGNHAYAYGRAILQLTALSSDELKYLSKSKIEFDISLHIESINKGNEWTGGGIEFFGQAGGERISKTIFEKNEILNSRTDLDFFVRFVDENGKDMYINKYFYKEMKNNDKTKQVDISIKESLEYQEYKFLGTKSYDKSYVENYMTKGGVKMNGNTIYISLSPENTVKYKEILSNKGKEISLADLCDIYKDVSNGNDQKLDERKNNYLAYEQKQAKINQLLLEQEEHQL